MFIKILPKQKSAVWVDEESYAVISDEGIDKEEMIKITESVVRNKNS